MVGNADVQGLAAGLVRGGIAGQDHNVFAVDDVCGYQDSRPQAIPIDAGFE